MSLLRSSTLLAIVCVALAAGCSRPPVTDKTAIAPTTIAELQGHVRSHKTNVDEFRLRGPFGFAERRNHEVRLSATERISTDLYLAAPPDKAPLAIFLHGYDSSKEAHANQAMHLASWGVHSLSVQLPRKGQWTGNARTLARIVGLIQRSPEFIDSRVDVNRIILVGHSFGASSVAIALAEGAPVAGAILLDPAAIGKDLTRFLQQIRKPVMVLGADGEVSATRNRDYFYRFIRSGVAEVSIRDATHEDAQYPSEFSLRNLGLDPYTTEEAQITFVSALTAAALSLSATGGFDYAWASFGAGLTNSRFFNAKRK